MHACQCAALAWDSEQFLETALRSLEQNPHPGICQLLVEKLAHTAATPTARNALARLHDPRRFHLPRETAKILAPLRLRLGSEGAEIYGRLRVNGRSARGMRVGLIEEAFWQQLRDSPGALAHRLVIAREEVGRRGAFRLRQVPPGRYLLLVGIPPGRLPQAPFQVAVRDSPGPIVIARGARVVDVGTVRLFMAWAPPTGPI